MKLTGSLKFELGHQNIKEWLGFSIPVLAAAIIAAAIAYTTYVIFP